jgi:hypothetical protein
LLFLVVKFLQEIEAEPNDVIKRICHIVELQQEREKLLEKAHQHQQKVKETFDRKAKTKQLLLGDLVLKWDSRREDHHGKFDSLWLGPFRVEKVLDNNTFLLQNLEGEEVFGGPVNGRFLKKLFY